MSHSVKNVCNGIYVYQNVFSNIDEIYEVVKKSSAEDAQPSFIPAWSDWIGNWEGKSSKIFPFSLNHLAEGKEEKAMKDLADAFLYVYNDYIKNNRYTDHSMFEVKDFDYNTSKEVAIEKEVSLLMYKSNQPEHKLGSKAMNYHTDTNHSDLDSPYDKKLITITAYLNDNYDGGEISFFDQSTNSIYNYKPKRGDVTIFPSHRPYYHGVLPFSGNDRYLVRMFMVYVSAGTKDWHKGELEYGKEKWEKMNQEKIAQGYRDSENTAYMSGDTDIHPKAIVFSPSNTVWVE